MDLVTLVAACALNVDLNVMHALIWQQSGGEPWSFSVPGDTQPQIYATIEDAIRQARAARPDGGQIRVGLTGFATEARSVTAAMFAPCPNITLAARQVAQLGDRCKTISRYKVDPIYCAVAVYHGSWERPDTKFAEAVRATVEKGDAPNFDMPKDGYFDPADIASKSVAPGPEGSLAALATTFEDPQRGWSSALFPVRSRRPDHPGDNVPNDDRSADGRRANDVPSITPSAARRPADSLFVPRSSDRRRQ